jgi:serine phosphatase RsbU (regulator of sigma subunit)
VAAQEFPFGRHHPAHGAGTPPGGSRPGGTCRPRTRGEDTDAAHTAPDPTASSETCAPPPVTSRTVSVASPSAGTGTAPARGAAYVPARLPPPASVTGIRGAVPAAGSSRYAPYVTTNQRHRSRWARALRPTPAQAAPALLTAVICVLAAVTPADFAVSRLLPVAPALAASTWSVPATLLLGLVAVAVVLVIRFVYDLPIVTFTAVAIAAVTAAAAYSAHVRLQRERTLSQVRSVADAAQAVVLRPVPAAIGRIRIETLYLAAAEEARIGGDFFEVVDTPHGVRLLIGDVRGKGLSAVGVAGVVINCFREAAYDEPDLTRLARRLDTSLGRYSDALPSAESAEGFATAVLTEIPHGDGPAAFVNCGHPPPLLLRHDGDVGALEPSAPSPPVNMGRLIGGGYTVDTVSLAPGDRLLFYTDGVTETRDRSGTFFPLLDWARRQSAVPPRQLLDLLHQQLLRYSGGGLDDDIAALMIRYEAADAAGPSRAMLVPVE